MHSHNVQLNIPFCAEMNVETIAILEVMICETKHEIQRGGNHPSPLVADVTKKRGSPRVKRRLPSERNHRKKNGREKREGKTDADDAAVDGRRIQRIKGKSTQQRRVSSLEVGTSRRAEN